MVTMSWGRRKEVWLPEGENMWEEEKADGGLLAWLEVGLSLGERYRNGGEGAGWLD